MPAFGTRKVAAGARLDSQSATTADLAGAIAVIKAGQLPSWTSRGPFGIVFILLVVAAVLWATSLIYLHDILRDYRFAGTWQPAYDMQVTDGKCTRYNFILTSCDAKIISRAEPDQQPLALSFMMAFLSGDGEPLIPVRSAVDPAQVTIAYAAETRLLNRTLTAITLGSIFTLIFLGVLSGLLKGRYKGGKACRTLYSGTGRTQDARRKCIG